MIVVVAFIVATFHLAKCSPSNVTAENYTEGVRLFGQASFKAVHENQPGNLIFSPAGVSMALTMLAVGAKGETQEQIFRGLRMPKNTTNEDLSNFVEGLNNSRGYELRTANKLFYNKDRTPTDEFISLTRKIFETEAQGVDFARSENASEIINDWCAAQTNQHIKKIIDPESIDGATEILLLNAIYFKGEWKTPFRPRFTRMRDFYVNGNESRKVPTMSAHRNFHYGHLHEFDARWIELPYAADPDAQPGDALSMFIVLPNSRVGLPDLMKNFHEIDLKSLRHGTVGSARIFLPKYKLESKIDLQKPLETLGFTDMFTKNADLSGIIEGSQLSVDRVFQKAFIEVNEKGTEATAATGISIRPVSGGKKFAVEHPFVALIMKGDGTLLFTAVINDPE